MVSKARTLLHELTHLPAIEGTSQVIITDQIYNQDNYEKAYGITWVEKLAANEKERGRTHLNADSYAWYASEKYMETMFGTPNAMVRPREDGGEPEDNGGGEDEPAGPTKALKIILENKRKGVPNDANFENSMKWLFYSVPFGTGSQCSANPLPVAEAPADVSITTFSVDSLKDPQYPGGTFAVKTQDGDCEYKNDGTGNPGALWCGGQVHSCKENHERQTAKFCSNLGDGAQIEHVAMVSYEW